jgi:hypothetical protein
MRVGAPAAQPSADRDPLRELDRESGRPAGRRRVRIGSAPREVTLGGAEQSWVDVAVDVERSATAGGADVKVVGEREPEEQRLDLMVARYLARQDAQPEVDLGLGRDAYRARTRRAVRGHLPGAAEARARPSTGGSAAARCAPLISPIERPVRRKYHAPMSVIGTKLRR